MCDEVRLEPAADLALGVEAGAAPAVGVSLVVEPPGAAPVEGNLVIEAARALRDAVGARLGARAEAGGGACGQAPEGARVTLVKRIPAAGGLGGGSSDAAAVLLGLRRLWGLSISDEALAEIAASLGSDVPFFLRGGTALATGRGADLEALPSPVEPYAVLLLASDPPGPQAKTARLYGLLDAAHYSGGEATAEVARRLRAGEAVGAAGRNVFDAMAGRAHPGHEARLRAFEEAGGRNPRLAGAGPSLFALARDAGEAGAVRDRLAAQGYEACAAPVLSAWSGEGLAAP